jgi:hypothetical protein
MKLKVLTEFKLQTKADKIIQNIDKNLTIPAVYTAY